jgi:hypothetical protein
VFLFGLRRLAPQGAVTGTLILVLFVLGFCGGIEHSEAGTEGCRQRQPKVAVILFYFLSAPDLQMSFIVQ